MHAYRDQYAQLFNLGRGVVVIAASADPLDTLADWAREDEFPFLMASDANLEAASLYGAVFEREDVRLTNRNLFVIGPDGRIAYTATPFREIDPTAYEELAEVIDRLAPTGAEEPEP